MRRQGLFTLSALVATVLGLSLAAQNTGSDHTAHLKAWDAHKALAQASPYRSLNWSYIGPTNISGRMTDVAVADHGTSRRLYAGSCCGGVWASDDLGATWQPIFDQAASTSTGALAVAPSNPDILWIGTGESNIFRSSYTGVGVFKSTDNAKTFQHMGLTDTGTIGRIVIHPTDANTVYVASAGQEWMENPERGVFKTTDGGRTWSPVLKISAKTGVNDIAMDPKDPNTLYAAAWQRQRRKWNDPRVERGFDESLIYKTTDAGKTWTKLTNGLPASNVSGRIGIAIARSNPSVVYAFYDNYECDTQAAGGGRGSNPGGSAATCAIKGNEIYRSNDKGATWTLVSGQTDEQRTYMKGMSNTYAWVFGNIRVDPTDENTVYTLALGASVSRDGGKTFGRIGAPPPGAVAGGPPVAPPVAGAPPAAGAPPQGGGRGANVGGDNHAMWIDPANTKYVITISESPKKKGLIYTGTDDGRMYVSIDEGKEFRELTANFPKKLWFSTVLASRHNEATVYAAQQGRYDEDFAPRLYKSTDYGGTFRSIAGNLPGGPINMIREDPVSPNVLYAANDFGVYVTTNGGVKWEVLGGNLPSVNVMDFIVHPRDRMLVIGTHGRGVWAIDVSGIK